METFKNQINSIIAKYSKKYGDFNSIFYPFKDGNKKESKAALPFLKCVEYLQADLLPIKQKNTIFAKISIQRNMGYTFIPLKLDIIREWLAKNNEMNEIIPID